MVTNFFSKKKYSLLNKFLYASVHCFIGLGEILMENQNCSEAIRDYSTFG